MKGFLAGYTAQLRQVFTDTGALLLMVIAIVIYSMFYPLPYLREVVKDAPVGVVDLDTTSTSRQLIRWADAHEAIRVTQRTAQTSEVETALAAGEIDGYLIIPSGFRADILGGRKTVIVYGGDAGRFLTLKQVLTGFAEAAGTLSASIEVRQLLASGQGREQAMVTQAPVQIRSHSLFNTREGYGSYLIPAVFVLILQQTLLLGVGLLAGTACEDVARPKHRPTPSVARFAGSCAALMSLYTAHSAFFFGFCFWLFDMPRYGDPLAIAVFLLPFLAACTFFAYALAATCRSRESSLQGLLVTSIPFLFLAGFAWPMELMPEPLQWFAHLVPSTAGIQGFLRLNQMGASLHDVSHWWWTLWILCGLYAWPAWHSWRRQISVAREDTQHSAH